MKKTLLLTVVAVVVALWVEGGASLAFQSPVSPVAPVAPPAEDHRAHIITAHNTPTPMPPPAPAPTAAPTLQAPAVLPETGGNEPDLAECLGVLLAVLMTVGIAVAGSRRRRY